MKGKEGKIYYKVLADDHTSCMASGEAEVKYSINNWAKAPSWLGEKEYHLLIFSTLKFAKEFASHNEFSIIYRCIIKNKITNLPHYLSLWLLDDGTVDLGIGTWPPGTIMAKQVKIIEQVKP